MMGTLFGRAGLIVRHAGHSPRCSVLYNHRHVWENGKIAAGIDGSNFDRVRTVSILARIQQESITDCGGRMWKILAYIGS